jgi:cell division protein ZapB
MPSFRSSKSGPRKLSKTNEPRDFAQLGLDFSVASEYIIVPRKEIETMNHELLETLENKVADLLEKYFSLKDENSRLAEENNRLQSEREGLKSRVDAILGKLDGI